MSWVSLSGSEGGESEMHSYKDVAKHAFASPTNLGSRLGHRTPSKDNMSTSGMSTSRRGPSRIGSQDEAEAFHQMFNSTAVQVTKKRSNSKEPKPNDLSEGLKALANKASRQYHADLSSNDESGNNSSSDGKESFSLGSVSRRTKDLDLAHNDNSFHVIGGLIVEFFQSKQKAGNSDLRLTAQDIAQLDRLAPPRVRASFVEAVRFRFTNAPMESTSSVHLLARQCHDLGLDADGPQNPLLVAAGAEIVIPVPRQDKTTSSRASGRSSGDSGSESGSMSSYPSSSSGKEPEVIGTHPSSRVVPALPKNSPLLPNFGRPPRQHAEDPPAKSGASISTRLTKMGVEVPYNSDDSSADVSTSHSQPSSSQGVGTGTGGRPDPNNTLHDAVGNSLTKMGIEMPRYGGDSAVSSIAAGCGASVSTDMKSMATSLTRLGVEIPLRAMSGEYTQSDSGASYNSDKQPNGAAKPMHHQPLRMPMPGPHGQVPVFAAGQNVMLSGSKTDEDSSILPSAGSSKEYASSEGMAKQQLMAELREASNLMAESKTQEAAKFWRDHVLELEARLRALTGDEASYVSEMEKQTLPTLRVMNVNVNGDSAQGREELAPTANGGQNNTAVPDVAPVGVNNDPNNQFTNHPSNSFQATNSSQNSLAQDAAHHRMDMAAARAPLMIDPSLEGVPMVDVVAPADLPGGYHFEAEIEGRRFLATVPAGGVQKGETFSCYMRDLEKVGSDIPVGRWRDGLFDCCSIGCCHPVICNGLFCPIVLLGQIMTRVGFDFLGRPSLDNSMNGPGTLWTILVFWVIMNLALFAAFNVKWSRGMELSMADLGSVVVINVAYILFLIYLTSSTRGSLREKYYIRESRFHDLEDCCCATFCLPCSVCQMARHTADYSTYEGVCCNETGLPDCYAPSSSGKYLDTDPVMS
ncbi:expressed unknown protein [Seminavis robusta]|uniref:Uncharacterized protein n=1 Tax=Seminavis robusta TaxID=568900 RepID=A0A9N8HJB8_9STRA|nr:expressed unknown protein [Seminavis robusta]|eukprot:Sro756_g197700.1 n/a (918) ;mRNA; r:6044-9076